MSRFVLDNAAILCLLLIVTLFAAACNVSFGFLVKEFLETLQSDRADLSGILLLFTMIFVCLRFLTPATHGLKEFISSKLSDSIEKDVRNKFFSHIHSLEEEFHTGKNTGDVQKRLAAGVSAVRSIVRAVFIGALPTIIEAAMIIAIVMYFFGGAYASLTLVVIGLYCSAVIYFTNKRLPLIQKISDKERALSAYTHDSFINHENVKLFDTGIEESRHRKLLDEFLDVQKSGRRSLLTISLATGAISAIGCFAILLWASLDLRQGSASVGEYLMLTTYLFQIFLPINMLGFSFRQIIRGKIDLDRMSEVLSIPSPQGLSTKQIPIEANLPLIIKVSSLSHYYEPGKPIFNGCSIEMQIQRICYIIGASGSGKTTFLKILCGLQKPKDGMVTINGVDIAELGKESLNSIFSVSSQNVSLFNDSILNNLLYAKANSSPEEINEAIDLAGLAHFVSKLPHGLSTVVGERAQKVSGGERQRIGIARAILKGTPVIVLDEPTSSLDQGMADSIRSTIIRLSQRRFVIVVTHDVSLLPESQDGCVFEISHGAIRHATKQLVV